MDPLDFSICGQSTKRTPRWPITNKARMNPARIKARLRQASPKPWGRFPNTPLRRGGMMFSSMGSIIRQPMVDRQASAYQVLGSD